MRCVALVRVDVLLFLAVVLVHKHMYRLHPALWVTADKVPLRPNPKHPPAQACMSGRLASQASMYRAGQVDPYAGGGGCARQHGLRGHICDSACEKRVLGQDAGHEHAGPAVQHLASGDRWASGSSSLVCSLRCCVCARVKPPFVECVSHGVSCHDPGLMLVLLYGRNGWFAPVIRATGFNIVFAFPGKISTGYPSLL